MSFFSSIGHALGSIAAPALGIAGTAIGGPLGGAIGGELGSIIGGGFAGGSAHQAGSQASDAANRGAQFDINRFNTLSGNFSPYAQSGMAAQGSLNNYLGLGKQTGAGYGSLLQPYHFGEQAPGQFNPTQFQMPSLQDFYQNSPAYAFQKQQGMQGVLNGGAASGGALSGAAQKDLIGYNQGLANSAWDNYYNQKLASQAQRYGQQQGQYNTNLGRYEDLNQLGFNQYNTQQNNIYSRLAGLSGMGLQSAADIGQFGSSLGMDTAQGISNAGMAKAWGTSNMGNILGGTAGVLGDAASKLPWQQWMNGGGSPWNPNQYDQHTWDQTAINAGNQLPQTEEIGGD